MKSKKYIHLGLKDADRIFVMMAIHINNMILSAVFLPTACRGNNSATLVVSST